MGEADGGGFCGATRVGYRVEDCRSKKGVGVIDMGWSNQTSSTKKTATRLFKYWRWGMGSSTEVLVRSIKKKANPIGEALERVTYNFFQSTENQVDYLKQESIKNFEAAFKAYLPDLPIWEVCSLCSQLCYP
ncbi:unnamed protein product [Ilex paraguariensis]|uniref:Uncharacterized protein n=1 Tax=Ilex paraguariensis TaxID=185542 RepID=A0ABC8V4X5_9AQUA